MIYIFISLFSSILHAKELTLQDVHKEVLEKMPLIIQAEEKVRASEGNLESQMGTFDHKLKFSTQKQIADKYDNNRWDARLERQTPWFGTKIYAGQRQGLGSFASYDGKYKTSPAGEFFGGVEIPLLRNRSIDESRLLRANASIEVERQKELLRLKKIEIKQKATHLYFKWVSTGKKLQILKKLVQTAEERQTFYEKKYQKGDVEKIKLTDNLRTLSKRKAEYLRGEKDLELARLELELYLGGNIKLLEENLPNELKLNTVDNKILLHRVKNKVPIFKVIDKEIEQLSNEREFAASLTNPEMNLAVEGAKDSGNSANIRDENELRVGLKIEIPLENRKGEGKSAEVRAKLRAIEAQKDWLHKQWENALDQTKRQIEIIQEQFLMQEQEVDATAKMARAEQIRLAHGDSDVFFVNIREQDEAEARLKYIDTIAIHGMVVADLLAINGIWAEEF